MHSCFSEKFSEFVLFGHSRYQDVRHSTYLAALSVQSCLSNACFFPEMFSKFVLFGHSRYHHWIRFVVLYRMDRFSAPDVNSCVRRVALYCTFNSCLGPTGMSGPGFSVFPVIVLEFAGMLLEFSGFVLEFTGFLLEFTGIFEN